MSGKQLRDGKRMGGTFTPIKQLVVMSGLNIICSLKRVNEAKEGDY